MKNIIYFDNAATTYPKPESVYRAADEYARTRCGNPSRGSHALSLAAAEAVYKTREALAELYGASPENVVFTMNTTYALNLAIKAVANCGDHILISNLEHNSVLRPVHQVSTRLGASYDIFDATLGENEIIGDIDKKRRNNTRLLVCTHQSNITPTILPIKSIAEYCRTNGIYTIVDCAQSSGTVEFDMSQTKIDAVCVPSHKGLYGLSGCGAIIFGQNSTEELKTTIEGGSGSESIPPEMPAYMPDRMEAGTLPSPAIVSLARGIEFIQRQGVDSIRERERRLCEYIMTALKDIDGVTVYNREPGSTLLFNCDDITPTDTASMLDSYGICVRAGLHCAPLAHKTLGTFPTGAVRASFGAFNTKREADKFIDVVERIIKSKK